MRPLCNVVVLLLVFNTAVISSFYCKDGNPLRTMRGAVSDKALQFSLGRIAFSLIPLTPETTGRRKTILTEVVQNRIWTFDQLLGVFNVNVPVRSVAIKLNNGGLFINNPVAPTLEYIDMLRVLESRHGVVKFIVLSSLAVEHKGSVGAFCRAFPSAQIYAQPGQYSFPVNLATELFFPAGRRINSIPEDAGRAPWYPEIDHVTLGPLRPRSSGGYAETAFFHRATSTLLVTDIVLRVPQEAPAIVQEDPRALMYHSRDTMLEEVRDTPEARRRGWRRIALFALVFQPAGIRVLPFAQTLRKLPKVTPATADFGRGAIPFSEGLYPWDWVECEVPSFRALQGGLLVAPILQQLILNREPVRVMEYVQRVCRWPFRRIIPAHFENDISATPADFRRAFEFLYEEPAPSFPAPLLSLGWTPRLSTPRVLPRDLGFLKSASEGLTRVGVLNPPSPPLRRRG